MAFASSIPEFSCVSYKLAVLLGGLVLGMGLYYLLEWRIRHDLADTEHTDKESNQAFEVSKGVELDSK